MTRAAPTAVASSAKPMTALGLRGSGLPARSRRINALAKERAMMAVAPIGPAESDPKPPTRSMMTAIHMAILRNPSALDTTQPYHTPRLVCGYYRTIPKEKEQMNADTIQAMLGWASLLNLGLLLFWFSTFMIAHDWVYRIHSNWFKMSVVEFDAIHYRLMGFYELSIFVVLLGPYLALRIIGVP
jgi:hypothetical protein